jgi:phosphoribosylformylglycinamidine cyclo-ligase
VLPDGLAARIDTASWQVPALFTALRELGGISQEEMWHTFNMGIGMICIVPAATAVLVDRLAAHGLIRIGELVPKEGPDRVALR